MQAAGACTSRIESHEYLNTRGIWITYVLLIVILHLILRSVPFMSTELAFSLTTIIHSIGSFLVFHYKKGTPWEPTDQGKSRYLTLWEQMDAGVQNTSSKKFFTVVPLLLFLLCSWFTHFDNRHFACNLCALLFVLIPKLSALHDRGATCWLLLGDSGRSISEIHKLNPFTIQLLHNLFAKEPKTRNSNPAVIQKVFSAIASARQLKQISTFERIAKFIKREYNVDDEALIESQIKLGINDGLLESFSYIPQKGHDAGREQLAYRQILDQKESLTDWYCFICHRPGKVISCSECWRVFHVGCLPSDSNSVTDPCHICQKLENTALAAGRKELNILLEYTIDRLKDTKKLKMVNVNKDTTAQGAYLFEFPRMLPLPDRSGESVDLSSIVYHHMDLSTIQENCIKRVYTTLEQFYADVQAIVHNVCIVFGEFSDLADLARVMIRDCSYDLDEIRLCRKCYYLSNYKPKDWFCIPCDTPHELVYAKHTGFPFWPGKVMRRDGDKLDIRFFGGHHERAFVSSDKVRPVDNTDINALVPKRNTAFRKAYLELERHRQYLRHLPEHVRDSGIISDTSDEEESKTDLHLAGNASQSKAVLKPVASASASSARLKTSSISGAHLNEVSSAKPKHHKQLRKKAKQSIYSSESPQLERDSPSGQSSSTSNSSRRLRVRLPSPTSTATRRSQRELAIKSALPSSSYDAGVIITQSGRTVRRLSSSNGSSEAVDNSVQPESDQTKSSISMPLHQQQPSRHSTVSSHSSSSTGVSARASASRTATTGSAGSAAVSDSTQKKSLGQLSVSKQRKRTAAVFDSSYESSRSSGSHTTNGPVTSIQPKFARGVKTKDRGAQTAVTGPVKSDATGNLGTGQTNSAASTSSCECGGKHEQTLNDLKSRLQKQHEEEREIALFELRKQLKEEHDLEKKATINQVTLTLQQDIECARKQVEEKLTAQFADEVRKLQEKHKETVAHIKHRQWCSNCEEEAMYHCCWNTAYCSIKCQQEHWHRDHKKNCRRKK